MHSRRWNSTKRRVKTSQTPTVATVSIAPLRFGSGLDGETNFLPGAPIQDRRISDAAEVRGHSRSETRRAAAAGGAARIAPVVHPTRVVAREDVFCSEVQYRAGEFVRRADGYAARH